MLINADTTFAGESNPRRESWVAQAMKQFNSFLVQHVGVSANTPEFLPRDAAQDHRVSRELRRSLRFIDLRCRGRRAYGEDSCRFPKGAAEWVASLGAMVIAAPIYTAERKVRQLFEGFSKKMSSDVIPRWSFSVRWGQGVGG